MIVPEFPDAVVPLLRVMLPDMPADPALLLPRSMLPEPALIDCPERTYTLPPAGRSAFPDERIRSPPAPDDDLPTTTLMLPLRPPELSPVCSNMDPVFPAALAPVAKVTCPETPAEVAEDVERIMDPEPLLKLDPLDTSTEPPAFVVAD